MRGSLARRAVSAARSGVLLTMRCKRMLIMICTIGRPIYARPAPASEDMKELIQLFAQSALLRRGPQDLPASTLLLALTVSAYLGVNLVVSSVLPPVKSWPAQVLVDTLFTLAWYVALLKLAGRAERILQTATAVFGLQGLLSPLLIASDWLMLRLGEDALWQVAGACAGALLVIRAVAARSQIVEAALGWARPAGVVLGIFEIFTGRRLGFALFSPL